MRTIFVSMLQNADLAVTQIRKIRRVIEAVGINANRNCHVVYLVVGKLAITLGFPGIENLAAQRQYSLVLFIAAHFG